MFKRLIRSVVIGSILGVLIVFGIIRYQNDQADIHHQVAEIQRQQELLLMFENESLPTLIKKAMPSVVYVEAPYWSGSGVVVAPHVVLTARHVVEDAGELTIETIDGRTYEAIAWVEDKKNDCGLIFFDPRDPFTNIAEFADSDELQLGDLVFTLGSPYGKTLFNTVTFGIISGLDRKIPYFGTCGLVTSDAAGNPGNSGGPIFNMQGRIIGIVVGTHWGAEGLNILIPANICRNLLENKKEAFIYAKTY